jgi:TRAP transporter TAXI family solute receptor
MLRTMDWRRWRVREYLLVFGPAFLLTAIAFTIAMMFIKPAPPRHIVMATGRSDGAYHQFGLRYQAELARAGIRVTLRTTSGAVENVKLLSDPAAGVDVAFVQGGVAAATDSDLVSLGSLYFEPLWVFARGVGGAEDLRGLRGRRIAVGPEGSGTRALGNMLLRANGVTTPAATLTPLTGLDAVRALQSGEIDAAVFVASPESATVREAVTVPDVVLMSFPRAEAYTRLFPYLSRLTLPEGAMNLERDIPRHEIVLLSPTASLVVRPDFHPALSDLLLVSAKKIHGHPGVFERPRQFPSPDFTDFPLSAEALRFYQSGPPFLARYLPFWAATLVDRMKIMLLPLIALLFPLFKIVPPTFRWRTRRKIYRWYREVHDTDVALCTPQRPEELDRLVTALDRIEHQVRQLTIPPAHAEAHFHLRMHIDLVRAKVLAARAAQR